LEHRGVSCTPIVFATRPLFPCSASCRTVADRHCIAVGSAL